VEPAALLPGRRGVGAFFADTGPGSECLWNAVSPWAALTSAQWSLAEANVFIAKFKDGLKDRKTHAYYEV